MTVPGEAPPATEPEDEKRLLPPFVFLGALVVMGALYQLAPGPELVPAPWNQVGWVPFGLAVALAFHIKFRFDRLGTPIRPFETSTALVTAAGFLPYAPELGLSPKSRPSRSPVRRSRSAAIPSTSAWWSGSPASAWCWVWRCRSS